MAKYGVTFEKATTSTTIGVANLSNPSAGSPRRFGVYDVNFGSQAAAGDGTFQFEINRSTTLATGSAVTPNALDPADPASIMTALENLTVQGTNTAGALPYGDAQNQRATFRWQARHGSEIIAPATLSFGFHFNTPVAITTPAAFIHAMYEEM